jgi:arabinosaccharide transport system substrate-binding protein
VVDRYLINFWPTISGDFIGIFIKQRYPEIETPDGAIHLDSPILAELMAELTLWCVNSNRVAGEMPMFSAAGWMLQREGYVVAMPVADWYLKHLKTNLPNMEGQWKLMPLPAWEPGGRRTSVVGGTCMTFFADSENFEESWELGKKLHFSRESARGRFRDANILTPISTYWDDPIYSEPDPYFGGQPVGELLIELAPDVPPRHSSPWLTNAYQLIQNILISVLDYANANDITEKDELIREIEPRLVEAQKQIDILMDRNPFYP